MREQLTKYLVDKLEHEKKINDLHSSSQINRAKMMEEIAKYDSKKQDAMAQLQSKGMLQYQSSNPNDGNNYPLIDVFAKLNRR